MTLARPADTRTVRLNAILIATPTPYIDSPSSRVRSASTNAHNPLSSRQGELSPSAAAAVREASDPCCAQKHRQAIASAWTSAPPPLMPPLRSRLQARAAQGTLQRTIGPTLIGLARRDSRASFSEYLWNEIENNLGFDPFRCGSDAFADRLQAWYVVENADSLTPSEHPDLPMSKSVIGDRLWTVSSASEDSTSRVCGRQPIQVISKILMISAMSSA